MISDAIKAVVVRSTSQERKQGKHFQPRLASLCVAQRRKIQCAAEVRASIRSGFFSRGLGSRLAIIGSTVHDPSLQLIQRTQISHVRVAVDLGPTLQKGLTSSEYLKPRKAGTRLLHSLFESGDMAAEAR